MVCYGINPEFPLVANNGYLPPRFTAEDYRQETNRYSKGEG
ncbi:MAG TPA: hypothetical protein VNQ55_05420 [Parapedobacter sp.]|nr:hypothetical protein [Parapedobacter sp.]